MIEISHLTFSYDGHTPVLQDINLTIKDGEFIAILGGNGSGKSTLAKHLNALLLPDEGSVIVDGIDTFDKTRVYDIRQNVGFVFQNPDDQIVAATVEDDIAFGPENLGIDPNEIRKRIAQTLEEVGLQGFEQHVIETLSGGQKQRVALAGALAMHPRILVLDEASSMLDPRGRSGLLRVCKELNDQGFTIVMITHFMDEAEVADTVVVLHEGRIKLQGSPHEVFKQSELITSLNLELPFEYHLAHRLREENIEIPHNISSTHLVTHLASIKYLNAGQKRSHTTNVASLDARIATKEQASVIQLDDISYTYIASKRARKQRTQKKDPKKQAAWGTKPQQVWALENISFSIPKGSFFGIAGHTGSGKSTLLQHLNGILKPTQGTVFVQGNSTHDKRFAKTIPGIVGIVFQYPEHQLFAPTVFEDVAFGPKNLGVNNDEISERVEKSLRAVGFHDVSLLTKSPFELSGGQQRRVAIAGVLAMKPDVLVLDEPTAGLDPASKKSLLDLVKTLHSQGITIVMVSHNMDDLARLCTHLVVLNKGRIFAEGSPKDVFSEHYDMKSVGLGVPHAQAFAEKLIDAGMNIPTAITTEDELIEALTSKA